MSATFHKVIHFTKLVKINGRLREFNYRKNNRAGENVFDVDTADERGNRIFFRLEKENEEWILSSKEPLPDWIGTYQQQLIEELEKGVAES